MSRIMCIYTYILVTDLLTEEGFKDHVNYFLYMHNLKAAVYYYEVCFIFI